MPHRRQPKHSVAYISKPDSSGRSNESMQNYANSFASFDFLLQRPALFGLMANSRSPPNCDLRSLQAFDMTFALSDSGRTSRILTPPGVISCTVFHVQMLRFRNDLTISGRFRCRIVKRGFCLIWWPYGHLFIYSAGSLIRLKLS